MMNNLILIRPSRVLKREIWEYRKEYLDFGETQVNGSCGLAYHDNFDEWFNLVLSIGRDKPRNNVHTITFFLYVKKTIKL